MSSPGPRPRAADAEWRLILGTGGLSHGRPDDTAAPGALNMGVDEALLESVRAGGPPVLRFYTWSPPCLSLGRNQPARDLYDRARVAGAGIDIVRRPTGGLAVLHDRELTYSVIAPLEPFGGPRAAYACINRALVEGLRLFGVEAEQATGVRARGPMGPGAEPCFQTPAAGEVVARGRKLVGSAQRCEHGTLLQHGSILLAGSQSRVLDFLAAPDSVPPGSGVGSTTVEELTGREPAPAELMTAMCDGFAALFGTRLAPGRLNQSEIECAGMLAGRFAGSEWTWRR